MSVAHRCLDYASLFEAELLAELMLRFWHHPSADDRDFQNDLLKKATQALREATEGARLIESLAAENTNLVAAIWYAEWSAMRDSEAEDPSDIHQKREEWLDSVRHAVPSCFADDVS